MCFEKNIFIPGAQKSGTSTVYEILQRHSQIAACQIKEPQFFALEESTVKEYSWWYENLFGEEDSAAFSLEASTFYFSSKWAHQNISRHVNYPYFLIVLRDPVQRAYSAHAHMNKKLPTCDQRSFDEIVKAIERHVEQGRTIREAESNALHEAIQDNKVKASYLDEDYLRNLIDAPFKSRFEDPLWPYRYFDVSQYHGKVRQFQKIFGASRVKVIVFEELVGRPSRVIKEVFDFLDLPVESPKMLTLPHKNRTRVPSGRVGRGLIWLQENSDVAGEAWRKLRSRVGPLAEFLRNVVWNPKPQLSKSTYERARKLLRDEYAYWEERIDCVGSMWVCNSR